MARAIPVLANLAIAALFLLCSVRATGQDKLTAFFDPDETNTRATEVVDALKVICPQGSSVFGRSAVTFKATGLNKLGSIRLLT